MWAAERVEIALRDLLKGGRSLQPATAVDRILRRAGGLTRLEVSDGLRELAAQGKIGGISPTGSVERRLTWTGPSIPAVDPSLQSWLDLVDDHVGEDGCHELRAPPKAVTELAEADQRSLIECLVDLNVAEDAGSAQDRYIVSARNVMGSSKVLDRFPKIVGDEGPRRPLFVLTAGPKRPDVVLFVENPSAFNSVSLSTFVRRNLVLCGFGYGLTMENFADRLRDNNLVPASVSGDRIENLSEVVGDRPCRYWGDLDLEGLRILEVMQIRIPHLRPALIYREMARCLQDRKRSHPYGKLFEKATQRGPLNAQGVLACLAELCRTRAVDQEALCPVRDEALLIEALSEMDIRLLG